MVVGKDCLIRLALLVGEGPTLQSKDDFSGNGRPSSYSSAWEGDSLREAGPWWTGWPFSVSKPGRVWQHSRSVVLRLRTSRQPGSSVPVWWAGPSGSWQAASMGFTHSVWKPPCCWEDRKQQPIHVEDRPSGKTGGGQKTLFCHLV